MTFSEETKEFLKENLSDIGRITQKYLMYPSISIRTKQQGMNVVEFYLHPNGDITELKLLQSSTYTALYSNSIHTIKVAYKDYPKPKEVTKIRIFVYYKLH
jgi:TonB family protein